MDLVSGTTMKTMPVQYTLVTDDQKRQSDRRAARQNCPVVVFYLYRRQKLLEVKKPHWKYQVTWRMWRLPVWRYHRSTHLIPNRTAVHPKLQRWMMGRKYKPSRVRTKGKRKFVQHHIWLSILRTNVYHIPLPTTYLNPRQVLH